MNSVMEIGILFLKDGLKAWEGNKEEIFRTDNEAGLCLFFQFIQKSTRSVFERVTLTRF
jgi:hypothetical protein